MYVVQHPWDDQPGDSAAFEGTGSWGMVSASSGMQCERTPSLAITVKGRFHNGDCMPDDFIVAERFAIDGVMFSTEVRFGKLRAGFRGGGIDREFFGVGPMSREAVKTTDAAVGKEDGVEAATEIAVVKAGAFPNRGEFSVQHEELD